MGDDLLVADGEVVLQGLAEVGDLARALVEDDGLVEEVALQVLADVVHPGRSNSSSCRRLSLAVTSWLSSTRAW